MTEQQIEFLEYVKRYTFSSKQSISDAVSELLVREVGISYGLSEFEISQCGMMIK